jgi:large subunit ribosomal protein L10
MNRESKESMVAELADKLSRAKAAVVANFSGLDVAAVNEIRNTFREIGVEYKVVKNSLMKRALTGTAIESLGAAFTGPTAVAFKFDDEVGRLGKAAKDLVKKFDKFEVKAAYIEEEVLSGNIVETMASLPTMDEARAQLLGVLNAPASQLLAVINAPGSNLVGVIQAKQKKDEQGAAA